MKFLLLLCLTGFCTEVLGFVGPATTFASGRCVNNDGSATMRPRRIGPSMCICINCAHVTNCTAYHFVEAKHEQPHINENATFTPRNGSPTIHVNVRTNRKEQDQVNEHNRMWLEHESETVKAQERAGNEGMQLRGEKVYDLFPVTTVEYDVVSCQDFVEDQGCWVRNMPEAIRIANPDFVPT